ncbi:MAG: peptide deformylase [Deltaproteobacteria bacterium]|nr:peptide deformylase [Deltaproteobacteria bacterium]
MSEALPRIVQAGDPVLRAVAQLVPEKDLGTPELRALVETMIAVMHAAPGVGLAAPQIGVPLRVIVLEDEEGRMARLSKTQRDERGRVPFGVRAFINPTLRVVGDDQMTYFEGCLSVSGWAALVPRARTVEVTGVDVEGHPQRWEVSGWPARILQHEVDHLLGTLYVDRMISRTFCSSEELSTRWADKSVDEVRKALGG